MAGKLNMELNHSIQRTAKRLNCTKAVSNMTDINAIRLLQKTEGYTQCFGRDNPLESKKDALNCCAITECYWRSACDIYRNERLLPLDKVFINDNEDEIFSFVTMIGDSLDKGKKLLLDRAVGVKLRSFEHASSVTRKLLIATPKTVIAEKLECANTAQQFILRSTSVRPGGYGTWARRHYIEFLYSSDINALKKLMVDTEQFRDAGNLAYYPSISSFNYETTFGKSVECENSRTLWDLPNSCTHEPFEAPYLAFQDGDVYVSDQEFVPILNVDLPVLENIDYETLFKLFSDFPDELLSLRDFLLGSVEDIHDSAIGSERFALDCERISRDIRDHMRKLASDYKKARLKAAFSLTGCAVVTWTLAVYCILRGDADLLTILGPSGIAYKLNAEYSDYLVKSMELKDDPVYLLWKIGKTKK